MGCHPSPRRYAIAAPPCIDRPSMQTSMETAMYGRTEKQSVAAEKQGTHMTASASADVQLIAQLVRQAAEPAEVGERVCAAILRAARNLGMPFSKTKRLWYGEQKTIPLFEALHIAGRLEAMAERRGKRREEANADMRQMARILFSFSRSDRDDLGPLGDVARKPPPDSRT